MVTHADLLRIARRYDTLMSHAMMRAPGYQGVPDGHHRHRKRGGGGAPRRGLAQVLRHGLVLRKPRLADGRALGHG